jgi:hypothetical protein
MLRGSQFPSPGFMIIDAGTASYNSFRAIIKTVHIPPESAFTLPWKPDHDRAGICTMRLRPEETSAPNWNHRKEVPAAAFAWCR